MIQYYCPACMGSHAEGAQNCPSVRRASDQNERMHAALKHIATYPNITFAAARNCARAALGMPHDKGEQTAASISPATGEGKMPFSCDWNGWVLEETAERECPSVPVILETFGSCSSTAEQGTHNSGVGGSSPPASTSTGDIMKDILNMPTRQDALAESCEATTLYPQRYVDALNKEIATLSDDRYAEAKRATILSFCIEAIRDTCSIYADGAPDASPRDKLANKIIGIIERDGR